MSLASLVFGDQANFGVVLAILEVAWYYALEEGILSGKMNASSRHINAAIVGLPRIYPLPLSRAGQALYCNTVTRLYLATHIRTAE